MASGNLIPLSPYQPTNDIKPYFTIQEAASLQATYNLLRTERCDVLVLGLDQPDGDGLAFLPLLCEQWPTSHLCIACYADRRDVDTKTLAYQRGADDYVAAPMQLSSIYGYRLRIAWRLWREARAPELVSPTI